MSSLRSSSSSSSVLVTTSKRIAKRKASNLAASDDSEVFYGSGPTTPILASPVATLAPPVLESLPGSTSVILPPVPVMTSTTDLGGAHVSASSVPVGQIQIPAVDDVVLSASTSLTSVTTSLMTSTPSIRTYAEGPSHKLKVLTKDSTLADVNQVIANIASSFHRYHFMEVIPTDYEWQFMRKLNSVDNTDEVIL